MAKKLDFSSILIERIIVHDIPRHIKNNLETEPNYSQQESKLSDGMRLFFKDKVVQALSSDKSFKICFDNSSPSPISYIIAKSIKAKGEDLVEHSQSIAKHLFEIQCGNNAAGILVIIHGKVNEHDTCMILKLEMDKGAQLVLDSKTQSYDIEEVKNLMLTQKTRIFKVALFVSRDDSKAKYDGLIMDYQIDIKTKKEVTTWFIEKFLGCIAFEDPKITTQKFYTLTRAYIDTHDDPITKTKYIQDLNSYVQKNSTTLSAKEFAEEYLSVTEHKDAYKSFMESKKFKFSSFVKDIGQIEPHIKKIMIEFENGISIVGNRGTFKDKVKLEELNNGQTRAVVTSKVRKIK